MNLREKCCSIACEHYMLVESLILCKSSAVVNKGWNIELFNYMYTCMYFQCYVSKDVLSLDCSMDYHDLCHKLLRDIIHWRIACSTEWRDLAVLFSGLFDVEMCFHGYLHFCTHNMTWIWCYLATCLSVSCTMSWCMHLSLLIVFVTRNVIANAPCKYKWVLLIVRL